MFRRLLRGYQAARIGYPGGFQEISMGFLMYFAVHELKIDENLTQFDDRVGVPLGPVFERRNLHRRQRRLHLFLFEHLHLHDCEEMIPGDLERSGE